MATISVGLPDGSSQTVTADDSFLSLPDDQKVAALGRLKDQIMSTRQAAPSGATPSAPAAPDTSLGSALQYGAANATTGLGNTAQVASDALPDGAPGKETIGAAAKWLKGAISSPKNYQPAGPAVAGAIRNGQFPALGDVGRSMVEATPDLAATAAAGVVGGGIGAAAYQGARNLGDNVQATAANNNDATPTTRDMLQGAATTVPQAILGAAGIGRAPGVSSLIESTPSLLKPLAKAGVEGAAAAANDQVGQIGTSVGTQKGLQDDPAQSGAAAIQGAGARLAGEVPGIVKGGVKTAADAAVSATLPTPDPEQAASNVRVGSMFDNAKTGATDFGGSGRALPDTAALNNVKSTLVAGTQAYARNMRDAGLLNAADFALVKTVIDQAQRHNNTITEGAPGGVDTLFDQVKNLDAQPQVVQPLVQAIRDLNTASTQSFLKNQTGPFQKIGQAIGPYVGAGAELASGNIPGAALGLVLGHGIGGKIGGGIGAAADRVFGTATPTVLLQRAKSQRVLNALGQDAGPDTLGQLNSTNAVMSDPSNALRSQLGIQAPPPPQFGPTAPKAIDPIGPWTYQGMSKAAWETSKTLQERAADQVSGMAYKKTDQALANRADGIYGQMALKSPSDIFSATDGMQGSPVVGRSDPLMTGATSAAKAVKNAYTTAASALPNMEDPSVSLGDQASNRLAQGAAGQVPGTTGQDTAAHVAMMGRKAGASQALAKALTQGQGGQPMPPISAPGMVPPISNPGMGAPISGPRPMPMPMPQSPVAGPAVAPPPGAGFAAGWKSYVHQALRDHGIQATVGDIHKAVGDLAQNGGFDKATDRTGKPLVQPGTSAQFAQALAQHGGRLDGEGGNAIMNLVGAQVAMNKGKMGNMDANRASASPPPGMGGGPAPSGPVSGRGPIRDPQRWEAARGDAKDHTENVARSLDQTHPDLAAAVRNVGAAPQQDKKQSMMKAHMASVASDPAKLAVAKRAFKGLKGGV